MTGSSSKVQLRRLGATAYIGPIGEVTMHPTTNRLHSHDGVTSNGNPHALLSEVVTATRTSVADANYTALATDRIIAFTSLTAARAVSLPAANAFPIGAPLWIVDESGACSGANYIAINRAGSDTVSGATSAILNGAYQALALESNGSNAWTIIAGRQNETVAALGVGTPPDAGNPLSVRAANSLFNAPSADVRVHFSKAAAANSAALVFEDAFSAHAQFGLLGDDNFHAQVSPNGSTWTEWIDVDKTNGKPTFPQGLIASAPIRKPVYAVAALPSASTAGAGACAAVSDASAPTFGAAPTGGGAVFVGVISNGTTWQVG